MNIGHRMATIMKRQAALQLLSERRSSMLIRVRVYLLRNDGSPFANVPISFKNLAQHQLVKEVKAYMKQHFPSYPRFMYVVEQEERIED